MQDSTRNIDKLDKALSVFSLQTSPPLHVLLQATAGQRRQWQAPSGKGLLYGIVHWKPGAAECDLASSLLSSVHSPWQQGHSVLLQHGRQSLSPLQKTGYKSHHPFSTLLFCHSTQLPHLSDQLV